MSQDWHDLLFAHWPVEAEILRNLVPRELPLDTFDGKCWVGVVPFRMSRIRLRGTFALPRLSAFPELNVRTYVTLHDRPGVYFFSLDASSLPAVKIARSLYKLPYYHAEMSCEESGIEISYNSARRTGDARFEARYRPTSEIQVATRGSLEHWLTERYCLYTVRGHAVYRAVIHHLPWPLQSANVKIETNTVARAAGIDLPAIPPLLHFAKKLEVMIWPLRRID